jgi:Domain of unknown function (DUF1707)
MSKARWTMDEHIRVSDADRERVVERLHEHFAAGRLTSDELDGRVTAALNAKTVGDLRPILTDLPEPELTGTPVGPGGPSGSGGPSGPGGPGWPDSQAWQSSPWAVGGRPMVAYRRGPRIMPLVLIALVAAIVIPGGGWIFLAFFKIALVFALVMCVLGVFAAARFRRHVRRYWQSDGGANARRYWQSSNDRNRHDHEWRR